MTPLPGWLSDAVLNGVVVREKIEGALGNKLFIETLEGRMEVSPDDWIIRGVEGELYPCKPDIFMKTYDRCEEPTPAPRRAP